MIFFDNNTNIDMRYSLFLFCLIFSSYISAESNTWILIDTMKKQLQVKRNQQILATFKEISIGRKGAGYKQKQGDNITPVGRYKISTIVNSGSRFKRFFGINYPLPSNARYAVNAGHISYDDYLSIIKAHQKNKMPPGDTNIGGRIGIHGMGRGNPKIQGVFDWTHGCIALSNLQIDELANTISKLKSE
jgi:murein L,D-transpeptidase YafK